MKKIFLTALVVAIGITTANAQFEKGMKTVKAKTTGLGLSILSVGGNSQTDFNLAAEGSYFVIDKLAITAEAGLKTMESESDFLLGGGARYYLSPQGWFVGAGLIFNKIGDADMITKFKLEGGYTWFFRENIFLEPALQFSTWSNDGISSTKIDLSISIGVKF